MRNFTFNYNFIIAIAATALIMLNWHHVVAACTPDGANCHYSDECCSGACSAAFGFCLHR
uniref:Conotoxin-like protein n=1 Tax=Malacosoma sp. alphabaculovirus TaxID=1881632 RepID=A0A1B1V5J8_9ABAC|nr:conotoxin-like protein [Malacosoma sp. alphabaculovirus]